MVAAMIENFTWQLVISLNGLVAYRDLFCVDKESGLLIFCFSLWLFWLKSIKNGWSQSGSTAHWDVVEINHNSIREGHGIRGPHPNLKKGLQDFHWSLRFKDRLGMGFGIWKEASGALYGANQRFFCHNHDWLFYALSTHVLKEVKNQ